VAFLQLGWVARANERGGGVCGEQAEEVDGHSNYFKMAENVAKKLKTSSPSIGTHK
jgi:hypothetical protein